MAELFEPLGTLGEHLGISRPFFVGLQNGLSSSLNCHPSFLPSRDLKPENFLFKSADEDAKLKVSAEMMMCKISICCGARFRLEDVDVSRV